MPKFVILILPVSLFLMVGCPKPTPGPIPPNPDAGGQSSTGGSVSPSPTAGSGGQSARGGTSNAGAPTCPIVNYPDTPLPRTLAKKTVKHKLPPRHFRPRGRAKALAIAAIKCSGGALPLVLTPLDQIDGSCTGAASVGMISSPPFITSNHFNIPDSLLAYQGGTCEDNDCAVCDCDQCPAAYCPSTHANDFGSNGGSVLKWMVDRKWLTGSLAADTTDALLTGLAANKTCVIGVDWRDSMWEVDPKTGEIRVDMNSPLVGGHEMHATFSDVPRGRVWVRNSWGAWGMCFKQQMTAKSATDGTGCGYGWISVKNLSLLRFDGDCPN